MITLLVRDAQRVDLPAVAAIYGHHLLHGLASFEETPPGVVEIERRWQIALESDMLYIIVELDDAVIGFAYCSTYRPRPAYRYTVEDGLRGA
jgi:phosphinothricin acetyltransferase